MNQQDIIKYLCDTQSYIHDYLKALENQHKIEEYENNMTIEQRIDSCLRRCEKDIKELQELLETLNSQQEKK